MKIYRTCSPSKLIAKYEMHGMLKLTMTCGGGMGGSRWEEYIEEITGDEMIGDQNEWVRNYLGEEIMLNPRFVVKMERVSVVKVVEDITSWKTYHSGTDGNQYLKTMYFEAKPFEKITLVDDYKYDENKDKLIKIITTVKRG